MTNNCDCQHPATIEYDGPAPTELPVTLAFAKQQAAIDPSDSSFDDLLTSYLQAATTMVQDWIGKTLITTSYIANWNFEFPMCMKIRENPELFVDRIEYIPAGEEDYVVLDPDMYLLAKTQHVRYVYPVVHWPDTDQVSDTARLYYSAGFGPDESSIPAEIKLAITMITTKAIAQRGDCGSECGSDLLKPAQKLLRSWKEHRGLYV